MQATETPKLTDTKQKTFSVLIIDDDADILAIFKHSLAQAGMHTYAFTNPMLAIEHFRRNANSYDIVVTDIRMPQMNGFQVARAVKQIRPDIKIAFATSFDINKLEFDKFFPSTEVDVLITKPVKSSPSMSTEVSSVLQHTLQGWCYKV
jgi:CheY-like chemotaxis protein